MAKEIERRFMPSVELIGEDAYNSVVMKLGIVATRAALIQQGYFKVSNPVKSFRVRVKDNFEQVKAFLTVKGGKGLVRDELEKEIGLELGKALLEISHHRIEKMRYFIDGWEIDAFLGPLKGIILLEKEMSSTDEAVELTPFLKSLFGEIKEVTDTLTSSRLARLATELRGLNLPAMPFVLELLRPIPRIGLAGDPGSGKTGVIKILKEEFPKIHFVPEAAKILIDDLGVPTTRDPVENRRFQRSVYDTIKTFRTLAIRHAIAHKKMGIVFDRPEADGAGYFDGGIEEFETFLGTSIDAEFGKIDIAIYMEIPSKEIYEEHKRKNPYRTETYEQAVARGERTKAVWIRHPNCHLIGNEGGWDAKVDRVRQLIKETIKA